MLANYVSLGPLLLGMMLSRQPRPSSSSLEASPSLQGVTRDQSAYSAHLYSSLHHLGRSCPNSFPPFENGDAADRDLEIRFELPGRRLSHLRWRWRVPFPLVALDWTVGLRLAVRRLVLLLVRVHLVNR
jgi:hypothetical protein